MNKIDKLKIFLQESKENSIELAHKILDFFEWYEEEEDE